MGATDNFFDLGGTSLLVARVHARLEELAPGAVSVVDLFQLPTVRALAGRLAGADAPPGASLQRHEALAAGRARLRAAAGRRAAAGPGSGPRRMTTGHVATGLEIAIIGMAGRFPGAATVDDLWAALCGGVEAISRFSSDDLRAAGVDAALLANPAYMRAAGVVADADRFDAGFFNYSPREAALIDPQQRVLLELAWAALEHAGHAPGTFDVPVGVYAGTGSPDYLVHQVLESGRDFDDQTVVANDKDFLATRVAYKLDLRGPASSSRPRAPRRWWPSTWPCQSLLSRRVRHGAGRRRHHRSAASTSGYLYQEGGIASPRRPLPCLRRAAAQGMVPGNGVGVVVLKRLARRPARTATAIHAVIRGTRHQQRRRREGGLHRARASTARPR